MAPDLISSDASALLLARTLNPQGSFPQSGSWSWVDLGKTTIQALMGLLQRYSNADVDPCTLFVGQLVLGNSFLFGSEGRRRVEEAITSLPSMNSMGKIVHFGFGINSVVRTLATTDQGNCLVVLCAAAAECYPEIQAASIMWEMVRCCEPPLDSLTLSGMKWEDLVRACAGSLSSSSFPKVAEHFSRLCSCRRGIPNDQPGIRSCSSSHSLAQALLGIGKVSTGELESITITGPSDAGWLAAIAEWILDLRIAIVDFDGTILYSKIDDANHAQIRFLVNEHNEENPLNELEIRTRTYHLHDYNNLLKRLEDPWQQAIVYGRIPWASALSGAFGSYFSRLHELGQTFGKALGCAARIFEAVKNAESGFSGTDAAQCSSYFASSYGKGFVSFACTTFPELTDFRSAMDQGASASAQEALGSYEACHEILSSECGCWRCVNGGDCCKSFCLVFILETILVMTRSLSGIEVAEGLYPLLNGLHAFYQRQCDVHNSTMLDEQLAEERFKCVHFILEMSTQDPHFVVARLADAVRLFARGGTQGVTSRADAALSAVTVGGITVFLDTLLDISDDPERIGLCHVIPGRINAHGRNFPSITDLEGVDPDGLDFRGKSRQARPRDIKNVSDLVDGYSDVSLVASETVRSLRVGLCTTDKHLPRVVLGPADITYRYLQSFGLVDCTCSSREVFPSEASASCLSEQLQDDGPATVWHFQGTMISRLIALADAPWKTVVRTQECLNCCKRTAARLENDSDGVLILSKTDS